MKYIKTDYTNGIAYLRVAIMDTLNAINEDKLKEQTFKQVSWYLLLDCIDSLKWKIIEANSSPSGTFIGVETTNGKLIYCSNDKKDTISIYDARNT